MRKTFRIQELYHKKVLPYLPLEYRIAHQSIEARRQKKSKPFLQITKRQFHEVVQIKDKTREAIITTRELKDLRNV